VGLSWPWTVSCCGSFARSLEDVWPRLVRPPTSDDQNSTARPVPPGEGPARARSGETSPAWISRSWCPVSRGHRAARVTMSCKRPGRLSEPRTQSKPRVNPQGLQEGSQLRGVAGGLSGWGELLQGAGPRPVGRGARSRHRGRRLHSPHGQGESREGGDAVAVAVRGPGPCLWPGVKAMLVPGPGAAERGAAYGARGGEPHSLQELAIGPGDTEEAPRGV
jgi:hypothetical protein